MQENDDKKSGQRRLAALALSLGAVAASVSAEQSKAVPERVETNKPVADELRDLRAQFETAFVPGAVDLADDASPNAPSSVGERAPASISGGGAPTGVSDSAPTGIEG